jgi:hypothetical protein
MKFIYKAPTEETALFFRHSAERELKYLDEFESKWGREYPLEYGIVTGIEYPQCFASQKRSGNYTTNAIESVHSQFRTVSFVQSVS